MNSSTLATVVQRVLVRQALVELADIELLRRFTGNRDGEAFAEIVNRYAALVWSVCRRTLPEAAAEDAFQTTFLVLAQKAHTLTHPERLPGWLHGVARRTALRQRPKTHAPLGDHAASGVAPLEQLSGQELLGIIEAEVARLPEKYRSAVLLCWFDDSTLDEAAQRLQITKGKLWGYLKRARTTLQTRLAARGLTAPALAATSVLGVSVAPPLTAATVRRCLAMPTVTPSVLSQASWAFVGKCSAVVCAAGLILATAFFGGSPTPTETKEKEPEAKTVATTDGFPMPEGALFRFGNRQLRHGDGIRSSTVSPDGKLLATHGSRSLVIWDIEKQIARYTLTHEPGNTEWMGDIVFSADSQRFYALRQAVGKKERWLRAYEVTSGLQLFSTKLDDSPAFGKLWLTKDGQEIGVGNARLWQFVDAKTGKLLATVKPEHETEPGVPHVAKQADVLMEISPTSAIVVCDARTGKTLDSFTTKPVLESTISPDGKLCAYHEEDGFIHVHDITAKKELYTFEHPTPAKKHRGFMAFGKDNKTLYVGGAWGHIYLCEVQAKPKCELLGRHNLWNLTGFSLSPDEKMLYSTGMDRLVKRWDLTTKKELPLPDGYITRTCFALTPDGKAVIVADHQGKVDYWSLSTGKQLQTLQATNTGGINVAVLTPDNRHLIAGRTQSDVRLFDLAQQKFERDLRVADNPNPANGIHVQRVGASPDSKVIYGGTHPKGVFAWERETGQVLWNENIACGILAVDPQGAWLAVAGRYTDNGTMPIDILDPKTGKSRLAITPKRTDGNDPAMYGAPRVTDLCVAAEGARLIAILTDGTFRQYDPVSGDELSVGKISAGYSWVAALSPDGKWLALGGSDYNVSIWDVSTNQKVFTRSGHQSPVTQVAFTFDGRNVVSNADLSPILWSLQPKELPDITKLDDGHWQLLASDEATRVYALQWACIANSDKALAFFKERIKPTERLYDRKVFDKLIEDLDSPRFAVREQATKTITAAEGKIPLHWLRAARVATTSEEVRERLTRLITTREKTPDLAARRLNRIVQVLELTNTPATHDLLREWTKTEGSLPALEAKAALGRLKK